MALDNIGDNIDKGADGFGKIIGTVKSNPIPTAIVMIIVCAFISIWAINHSSAIATDAAAKQRDKDDTYYLPKLKNDDDTITLYKDMVLTLSIEIANLKAASQKHLNEIDSIKHQ